MPNYLKGKLLEDYDVNTNDFSYKKDQIVNVAELDSSLNSYAIYHNLPECNVLDWVPKQLVEII